VPLLTHTSGHPWTAAATNTAWPLQQEVDRVFVTAAASNPHAAVAVSSLVDEWKTAAADPTRFSASKLLLLTSRDAAEPELLAALTALASRGGNGSVAALDSCGNSSAPGCGAWLESRLIEATRANSPALVLLRRVDSCATDDEFDSTISIIEKFVDPLLGAPVLTVHGEVRASLSAFVLVSSHLEATACEEAAHLVSRVGPQAVASVIETMWPAERFSAGVLAARRALLNRLGSRVAFLC
jgi:hypothetical protein